MKEHITGAIREDGHKLDIVTSRDLRRTIAEVLSLCGPRLAIILVIKYRKYSGIFPYQNASEI